MSVLRLLSRFMAWRWMPLFALTGGALAFVGVVLLVMPTNLGGHALPAPSLAAPAFPQANRRTLSAVNNNVDDMAGHGRTNSPTAVRRLPAARTHRALMPKSDGFASRLEGHVSRRADLAPRQVQPAARFPARAKPAPAVSPHLPLSLLHSRFLPSTPHAGSPNGEAARQDKAPPR